MNNNQSSTMAGLMEGMRDRENDDENFEFTDCPYPSTMDAAKNWHKGYTWVDRPEYEAETMDNLQFEKADNRRIANLVGEYYLYATEKYDLTICTGGQGPEGYILFANPEESKLSTENTKKVEKECREILNNYDVEYSAFHEARSRGESIKNLMVRWDNGIYEEFACEFLKNSEQYKSWKT